MNKLYWIGCDDKDTNQFEGRFQGRTRGEALKFLKQSLGRKNLCGLVFTITEIPVPMIREIVAEILRGKLPETTVLDIECEADAGFAALAVRNINLFSPAS